MSAVKHIGAVRNLIDVVDEDYATFAKTFDDGAVVHDFVINVEGGAEQIEGLFQALNRHVHPGAKTTRIGKNNAHYLFLGVSPCPLRPHLTLSYPNA